MFVDNVKFRPVKADLHARVFGKHPCDPHTLLKVVDGWIDNYCGPLSRLAAPPHQYRLFYCDKIYPDVMLRLYPERGCGHTRTVLVLARVEVAQGLRGEGLFTILRRHLEYLAVLEGWKFIVESANRKVGNILRNNRYFPLSNGALFKEVVFETENVSWQHDPFRERRLISISLPHDQIHELEMIGQNSSVGVKAGRELFAHQLASVIGN